MKFIKTKERYIFDGEKDLTFSKIQEYGIAVKGWEKGDTPYTIQDFDVFYVGKKNAEKIEALIYFIKWLIRR